MSLNKSPITLRETCRVCGSRKLVPILSLGEQYAVGFLDSAEETAAETARTLSATRLSAAATADPDYRFIASDDPLQFLQLGQRFLGGTMEGVEIRTLG